MCIAVPSSPANIKLIAAGASSAIISWIPPKQPCGQITRFTVYWNTSSDDKRQQLRKLKPEVEHYKIGKLQQRPVTVSTSKIRFFIDAPIVMLNINRMLKIRSPRNSRMKSRPLLEHDLNKCIIFERLKRKHLVFVFLINNIPVPQCKASTYH